MPLTHESRVRGGQISKRKTFAESFEEWVEEEIRGTDGLTWKRAIFLAMAKKAAKGSVMAAKYISGTIEKESMMKVALGVGPQDEDVIDQREMEMIERIQEIIDKGEIVPPTMIEHDDN